MASTLNLFRNGAVGFIDWLDGREHVIQDVVRMDSPIDKYYGHATLVIAVPFKSPLDQGSRAAHQELDNRSFSHLIDAHLTTCSHRYSKEKLLSRIDAAASPLWGYSGFGSEQISSLLAPAWEQQVERRTRASHNCR